MRDIFILLLITCIFCIVDCLLPDLSVRRVDKNFIAKKRQDTFDMCRIFTEESKKKDADTVHIVPSYRTHPRNRVKRDVSDNAINPALGERDAQRVEEIVEKLYEDEEDVTLRPKLKKKKSSKPSRRFDFKPELLLGPEDDLSTVKPPQAPEFISRARWKHGIVPYFIDPKTYDAQLAEAIILAFDYVEKATCIRLQKLREKPRDKKSMRDVDWIYITNPTGIKQCVHSNENRRLEGVQMIVFGYDCMDKGDIVHEVMHILGFSHEHLRSDRDQYISIIWDNIKPGYRKYFDPRTLTDSQYKLESLPYDYASILHYPPRAFSKNGKYTILNKHGITIGQREGLSEIDIEKVGLIYSGECVDRNREYLLKTCPSVVRAEIKPTNVTQTDIEDYFNDRIWPHGVVYYKFKDDLEFSAEEKENIRAVFRHIEKETCIKFQITSEEDEKDVNTKDAPFEEQDYGNEGVDRPDVASDYIDEYGHKKKVPKINIPQGVDPNQSTTEPPDDWDNEISSGAETGNTETDITETGNTETVETETDIAETGNTETVDIETDITDTGNTETVDTETDITETGNTETGNTETVDTETVNTITDSDKPIERQNKANATTKQATSTTKNGVSSTKTTKKDEGKKVKRESKKIDAPKKLSSKKKIVKSKPIRRHLHSAIELKRITTPGCKCPEPMKVSGHKLLELSADCFNSVNDLLHFFVHVLGLDHQHNMHDRDSYLHINWDNLTPDVREEMSEKLPPAASLGFPYDYQSVMHYPWLEIKNGVTNIMYPIWNDGWAMGHWQGLSSTDVQKLNLLYFNQCTIRQHHEKSDARYK